MRSGRRTSPASPCRRRYSSDHSLRDAEQLARQSRHRLSGRADRRHLSDVPRCARRPASPACDVAEQNIQARVRGAVLMAFSNTFGRCCSRPATSPSSPSATARSTATCAAASPYQRRAEDARLRSGATTSTASASVIPQSSITKAPSAELQPESDRPGHAAAVRDPRPRDRGLCRAGRGRRRRLPSSGHRSRTWSRTSSA